MLAQPARPDQEHRLRKKLEDAFTSAVSSFSERSATVADDEPARRSKDPLQSTTWRLFAVRHATGRVGRESAHPLA